MSDDKIEAEYKFTYRELITGVNDIFALLQKLEDKSDTTFAKFADNAKKGFEDIKGAAEQIKFDRLLGSLEKVGEAGKNLFAGTIGTGQDFQAELLQVDTIAKFTAPQLEAFSEKLRTLSRELKLGVTPTQAAKASYEVLSSGFTSAAQAQDVLTASLKLASVGRADADATTKVLAGTLNAYSLSASEAARVSDVLFQTVNLGVTTVPELAQSLGLVTSTSAAAGVSFNELAAAIATSTLKGKTTSSTIDGLRGIISALLKPTAEAEKIYHRLGIQVDANTLKHDGLLKTLVKINAAANGQTDILVRLFGDQVAAGTALALVSDKGKLFADTLKQMDGALGSVDDGLKRVSGGAEASSKRFSASVEALQISTSRGFLPIKAALSDIGTSIIETIDKLPDVAKAGGLALIGIGTAMTIAAGATAALGSGLLFVNSQLLAININIPAMIARQGVAIALTAQLSVATYGWAGALAAAATAAGPLLVAMAGLALIGVAAAFADANTELSRLKSELVDADGKLEKFGKGSFSTGSILSGSVKDLVAQGLDAATISKRIIEVRRGIDEAMEQGDKAQADKLRKVVGELIEKRTQVAEFIASLTGGKAPEAAKHIASEREIAAQKKAKEEYFKDELQKIELDKVSHKEKITRLKALRNLYSEDGNDRRRLDREIYQQEKADAANQHKYMQELRQLRKKERLEAIKEELQKVDNSKDPDATKLETLKKLLSQHQKNGDERRAIEDRIFKTEEALQKRREQNIQKLEDLRKQALATEIQDSEKRVSDLDKAQSKGQDTEKARLSEIALQAAAKKRQIQIDTEKELEKFNKPEDAATRKQILSNGKRAQREVDTDAARQVQDVTESQDQGRRDREKDLINTEKDLAGVRIGLLKDQAAAGKDVAYQLRKALEDRLKLQEEEIELQKQSTIAATEDARKIAAAEQSANSAKIAARKAAQAELDGIEKAAEDRKRAKQEANSKEFKGGVMTLDQFLQGEANRFGDKQLGFDASRLWGPDKTQSSAFSTASLESSLLNSPTASVKSLQGASIEALAKATAIKDMKVDITMRDEKGRALDYTVNNVTIDGRNSTLSNTARGMSPR